MSCYEYAPGRREVERTAVVEEVRGAAAFYVRDIIIYLMKAPKAKFMDANSSTCDIK
jgi:hypothetical protein